MTEPIGRNNPVHQRTWHNERTGREENHAIVYDHRAPQVVARDRFAQRWNRGYRPEHEWQHFHPAGGWIGLWGITNWNAVSTVTCEVANEQSGELYPVTANVPYQWNDAAVDSVLDQALDECAGNAGGDVCVPVQPACTHQ